MYIYNDNIKFHVAGIINSNIDYYYCLLQISIKIKKKLTTKILWWFNRIKYKYKISRPVTCVCYGVLRNTCGKWVMYIKLWLVLCLSIWLLYTESSSVLANINDQCPTYIKHPLYNCVMMTTNCYYYNKRKEKKKKMGVR
jgi:hypothetical protein